MASYGDRVKALRDARRWSQDDLVRESGFAKGTIHNWETGKTEPKLKDVVRMAGVFGVSLADLAGLGEGGVPAPIERRSGELPARVEELAVIQSGQTDAINELRDDVRSLQDAVAEVGRLMPMLIDRLPSPGDSVAPTGTEGVGSPPAPVSGTPRGRRRRP